jgi:hypothetical protein
MKTRQVFSTPNLVAAREAISAARGVGVPDEAVSLVARSDIEMEAIPEQRLDVSTDSVPAAVRGIGAGGAIGLLAGLIAIAIPPIGITVAGIGLITVIGAAVGGWSAALAGTTVPNAVRRRFESEIDEGRILVVLDDVPERAAIARAAIERSGATALHFEAPSALG